jgi:hypothetical protein
MKQYKIKCPLSLITIEIYVGTIEEFIEMMETKYKIYEKQKNINKYSGLAKFIENGHESRGIVWLEKFENTIEDIRVLSHEILHIAFNLYDYMNAIIDNTNQEAFIYFYERLFEQALEKLK